MIGSKGFIIFLMIVLIIFLLMPSKVVDDKPVVAEEEVSSLDSVINDAIIFGKKLSPTHPIIALVIVVVMAYIIFVPILSVLKKYFEYNILKMFR